MIIITGTITMDPAKVADAVPAIAEVVTATNAEEGCVTYGFWESAVEPGNFRVYEEWADDDALNSHIASEHMATFMGAAGGFGITGMELWRLDGAERTRFM